MNIIKYDDKIIINNSAKTKHRIMKLRSKTQFVEDDQHLCVDLIDQFPTQQKQRPPNPQLPNDDADLHTNFGLIVNNPFCFILLHLRNKTHKNPIHVNIPQVCIFHDKIPYDIIYCNKGFVKGCKLHQTSKVRIKDINKVFKQAWVHGGLPKNEPSVAAFAEEEMLMLSDNDLYLVSCKTKIDPFFKKLRYIRNKIPANNSIPILSQFNHKDQQHELLKLATTSLMGFKNQQQTTTKLLSQSQQYYLKYQNSKIVLFLNYQHNIRIISCIFVYIKTNDGRYYLVNVKNLVFTNLTNAIAERQKRLAQKQQQRNKILIMTPEKQARYRSFQDRKCIKVYQQLMTTQFNSMLHKMNFHSISDNKKQQTKNELAFKKFHPKSKYTYTQVITSSNFMKVKDEVLQKPKRKMITMPSKYQKNNACTHKFSNLPISEKSNAYQKSATEIESSLKSQQIQKIEYDEVNYK